MDRVDRIGLILTKEKYVDDLIQYTETAFSIFLFGRHVVSRLLIPPYQVLDGH